MKLKGFAALSLAVVLALPGCDMVRSALGKPTSADLAVMRKKHEIRVKALQDSVEAAAIAAKATADSLQAVSREARELKRYNVITGFFSVKANAEKHMDALRQFGYSPFAISLPSGAQYVAILSTDDSKAALGMVKSFAAAGHFSEQAWIYDSTKSKKHTRQL